MLFVLPHYLRALKINQAFYEYSFSKLHIKKKDYDVWITCSSMKRGLQQEEIITK